MQLTAARHRGGPIVLGVERLAGSRIALKLQFQQRPEFMSDIMFVFLWPRIVGGRCGQGSGFFLFQLDSLPDPGPHWLAI